MTYNRLHFSNIFDKLNRLNNIDSSEGFFVKYDTKFVEPQYWKYYRRYYRAKKRAEALEKELKEKDELRKAYLALLIMLVKFLKNESISPNAISICRKALDTVKKDEKHHSIIAPTCLKVIETLEKKLLSGIAEQGRK